MSTVYSADVRYGFSDYFGYGDGDPALPDIPDLDPHDATTGNKWLEDNGLNLLEFDFGGNQMSGPLRWSVIVKDLGARASKWDEPDGITHLGAVSSSAHFQLHEARRLLDRNALQVGWMLLWDVS